MCGIVGYIGPKNAASVLLEGLKRLEYRGYDSCGIAILDNGTSQLLRAVGRISGLEARLKSLVVSEGAVRCGIGHTRWATHGRPTEENAHPHRDCTGNIFVAHNGIIENYSQIKAKLLTQGHQLRTETDTEVLPHLIESYFQGNLEEAVLAALREVEGVYALAVISTYEPGEMVAARNGPPLVVGLGEGENFVASDIAALLPYTRDMVFLNDSELVVIGRNSTELRSLSGKRLSRGAQRLNWCAEMAEKNGYPHFMLKEICEQPQAIENTLQGRIDESGDVTLENELANPELVSSAEHLKIVACGTSLHAALVGKFMIETLARIPVEVDYASEHRYRNPILSPKTLVLAITQSGETADTLASLYEAREKGAHLLSICNVYGSLVARQSDSVLYTQAGPEIGVASTKAFTTQLTVLFLLALFLGKARNTLSYGERRTRIELLRQIPGQIERVLGKNPEIAHLAKRFSSYTNFLYLGRGISYPIALEGALKLKEISYIHAEGYPAGEMKHGPIALIDAKMPVVVLMPRDTLYRKTMDNLEEVKARDGIVLAVASEGDCEVTQKADHTIFIPSTDPLLTSLLSVVPLQLLAYHAGVLLGRDVDKPRNLAKSVTVE